MIRKIEIGATHRHEVFAEPTPLGLIGLVRTHHGGEPPTPTAARLSAAGIDFYEQVVLKKDQFA